MSNEDSIQGLPTLDRGIVRRRRGEVVDVALQLLDLCGGPTEPIRVRAISVHLPDDPGGPIRSISTNAPSFDVTADVDPISGKPLMATAHAWACTLDAEATANAQAVRRVARAQAGVNLRSSLERRRWTPGLVLSRSLRQVWARREGVKESAGHRCLTRLAASRCRGDNCELLPGSDHSSLWIRDWPPHIVVTQPSHLEPDVLSAMLRVCRRLGLRLRLNSDVAWHAPEAILVEVLRGEGPP